MKAMLSLELFHYNMHCRPVPWEMKLRTMTAGTMRFLVDEEAGRPHVWVAEITGRNDGGLVRSFLRGELDITGARSGGKRGVLRRYVLDSGHIYEVKKQLDYTKYGRYFCTVDDEGDIVRLSEQEVNDRFSRSRL